MKPDQAPGILKRFLQNPDKNFQDFFEVCYRLALGYLRYLRVRGYQLHTDQSAGLQPLNDLAIDILGPFLRSTSQRSFVVIFDYFRDNGLSDFDQADAGGLFDLFKTLLFGYIKQELRRISHEANPQLENLKRRFEEILAGPRYKTYSTGKGAQEYVWLADGNLDERSDLPFVSYEGLLGIVEQAYCMSLSRSEWCLNIFSKIAEMKTTRNCVRKYELIRAAVATNVKYAEAYSVPHYSLAKPEDQVQVRRFEEVKRETLAWLGDNSLSHFVQKRRVSPQTADRFMRAVDMYLTDLIYSGEKDKLPVYFREVMPPETHEKYLSDYKYCFEEVVQQAEEEFTKRIKKSFLNNVKYSF